MGNFKSKDYRIFRIRYYADRKILDRFGPSHPQHWERAREFNKFIWQFIEHVTGKNHSYHLHIYMIETQECVFEDLIESHGILTIQIGGEFEILIPLKNPELIKWMEDNTTLPLRTMKRTSTFYLGHILSTAHKNTHNRERSMEFTAARLQEWFIAENTRNVLIEKDDNRPNKKRVNQFKDLL
jgi:hypothetical protein